MEALLKKSHKFSKREARMYGSVYSSRQGKYQDLGTPPMFGVTLVQQHTALFGTNSNLCEKEIYKKSRLFSRYRKEKITSLKSKTNPCLVSGTI